MCRINQLLLVVFIIFGLILLDIWWLNLQRHEYLTSQDPTLLRIKNIINQIEPASKNLRLFEGNKSYTVNKKDIYLCLKDKKTNKYYDDNTLIFVALHELAHVLNQKSIGHDENFNERFDSLLNRAVELGLFNPNKEMPLDYCQ